MKDKKFIEANRFKTIIRPIYTCLGLCKCVESPFNHRINTKL